MGLRFDPDALPVYVGSHLDTQPTGGKYDGVLGVLGGLELLRTMNDLGIKIVISGYTDNRGTEEYNLALGERRAAAARSYLVNLGVPANQMTIVSYGELRPLQRGNNEEAWAMNRRAQFAPLQ